MWLLIMYIRGSFTNNTSIPTVCLEDTKITVIHTFGDAFDTTQSIVVFHSDLGPGLKQESFEGSWPWISFP